MYLLPQWRHSEWSRQLYTCTLHMTQFNLGKPCWQSKYVDPHPYLYSTSHSRKYWRSLNLVIWPQIECTKILAKFKFCSGALQRITSSLHVRVCIRECITRNITGSIRVSSCSQHSYAQFAAAVTWETFHIWLVPTQNLATKHRDARVPAFVSINSRKYVENFWRGQK